MQFIARPFHSTGRNFAKSWQWSSTFHFKNGQVKRSVNYVSDILHGEDQSFFISGQVKEKTTYMSGKKSGPY